jgi:hypothetical protein
MKSGLRRQGRAERGTPKFWNLGALAGARLKILEFEAVPTLFDEKHLASQERLNFSRPAVFYG